MHFIQKSYFMNPNIPSVPNMVPSPFLEEVCLEVTSKLPAWCPGCLKALMVLMPTWRESVSSLWSTELIKHKMDQIEAMEEQEAYE